MTIAPIACEDTRKRRAMESDLLQCGNAHAAAKRGISHRNSAWQRVIRIRFAI
jgi:hypothetical protein